MTFELIKKHRYLLLGLFVLIVLAQWFHFAVYFNQPVGISLLWSVVDWSVWFAIGLGFLCNDKFRMHWMLAIGFVVLAGPAQITLSSAIYQILYETDKSLVDSFTHLMNKRWLQNIFIAGLMVLMVMYLQQRMSNREDKTSEQSVKTLLLSDGKHTYQVDNDDVLAIVAAKNYLSVLTSDKEIVVRDTLKNMQSRLKPDQFIQVSRSALVNKSEIKQIERYSKTSFRAVLSNQHTINIGRTFTESVQQCLKLSPQENRSSL